MDFTPLSDTQLAEAIALARRATVDPDAPAQLAHVQTLRLAALQAEATRRQGGAHAHP